MSMSSLAERVVGRMVSSADIQRDGSGIFHGTPRPFMEREGTSSGPLYDALRDMGLTRSGHGQTATWKIPKHVMEKLLAEQAL